jgi:hypothetical protein
MSKTLTPVSPLQERSVSGVAGLRDQDDADAVRHPGNGPGMVARLTARVWAVRSQLTPVAVATLAAVGCVVLAVFDPRQNSFYPRCPFRAVTGRACAGCGITRGLHQLLTGHPIAALRLNLLMVVLVPASLYGYAAWALPRWGGPKPPTITLTSRNIIGGIVVLLLFTLLRNLPWTPFSTFSSLN